MRRQHCSSLCSQSEGHEHVANMSNALAPDFVGFLAVFGRHNIRGPHFASKVSYSASPQTFAECSRCAAPPCYLAQNRAEFFLDFEHTYLSGAAPQPQMSAAEASFPFQSLYFLANAGRGTTERGTRCNRTRDETRSNAGGRSLKSSKMGAKDIVMKNRKRISEALIICSTIS